MCADDEDRIRFLQLHRELNHELIHRPVAGIPENRQRASPMGEIDNLSLLRGVVLIHMRYLLRSPCILTINI
jgi:hypothetical protein